MEEENEMIAEDRRRTLEQRHAKLDHEISKEAVSPFSDDIETTRKKKLKLALKDGIEGVRPS
jgi:hypothetical protein